MNKAALMVMALSAGAVGGMFAPAFPPVDLQPTTPGTAQVGNLNISGTAKAGTVRGDHVFGNSPLASGTVSGGDFRSASTSGRGVYGLASAAAGTTTGGMFYSSSTAGRGVFGAATATSGTTFGGRFEVSSPNGRGVMGTALATTGSTSGVYGQSNSTTGYGVFGFSSATTGTGVGVFGQTAAGSGGIGVYGRATASGAYAGRFVSDLGAGLVATGSGNGVVAQAMANGFGYGVLATKNSPATASGYAIYGNHYGGGFALYGVGNLGASGNKSFRIDHPQDPENKYLLHYSMEGPDVLNVYTGNVKTDARGYATITLPDYFGDINRDPRYNLTVIDDGDDFVMVKVVRKVVNNQFVIRTSKPKVEVSWEVKGIRNDRFNQRFGAPVVVDKPDEEKGKYQIPELYGKGQEYSIDADVVPTDRKQSESPNTSTKN